MSPRLPGSSSADRDANWVERISSGDRDAFASLYREYLATMVGFAYRMVQSTSVAEDIAADVFTKLWTRRGDWRPQYGARAYLFRAVRMQALDYLRNTGTVERIHEAAADTGESPGIAQQLSPEEQLSTEQALAIVSKTISQMPEARRRVMELRWQHGLPIEEIAEVMGVSRAAVDQHLARGLRALRETLPGILG